MELLESYLDHIQEDSLNEFIIIPAIILAAAVYRQYYSKAAKACSDMSWEEKQKCMLQYEVEALQRANKELTSGKKQCQDHKDPPKCILHLDKKRKKYEEKIKKNKTKLKKIIAKHSAKPA